MKGLTGLFASRKAVMVMLMFAGLTALLVTGKLNSETYAMLVGGIKAAWLGAHSHEESSKAKAGAQLIDQFSEAVLAEQEHGTVLNDQAATAADKDPADEKPAP